MNLSRRGFFIGLTAIAVTAPAIVRAASLMPVKQMLILPDDDDSLFLTSTGMPAGVWRRSPVQFTGFTPFYDSRVRVA